MVECRVRQIASGDRRKGSFFKLSPFMANLRKHRLGGNVRRLLEWGLVTK